MNTKLAVFSGVVLVLLLESARSQAANYYLHASQASGKGWLDTAQWYDAATGGTALTTSTAVNNAANVNNTFDTNGYTLRTTQGTGTSSTFGGNILLNNSVLHVKTYATVTNTLTVSGTSTLVNSGYQAGTPQLNNLSLTVGALAVQNDAVLRMWSAVYDSTIVNRTLTMNIGSLNGGGTLLMGIDNNGNNTPSIFVLNVTDSTAFDGNLSLLEGSSLTFSSAFSAGGFAMSLGTMMVGTGANTADCTTLLSTDALLAFDSFSIDGVNLADGNYSMTQLADTYGAQYFSGTGSITVGMIPEPSVGLLLMLGIAGLGLLKMYRQKRREGMKMNKAIICPIS